MPTASPLHVLTLTPFYPREGDDASGCFIAEPLRFFAANGATNTVIAVQPAYRGKVRSSATPPSAQWVRFFALPSGYGLASSGAFLFARLLGEIRRIHAANPIHMIHAHSALPSGHAAALLQRELGIPFAVTVHGLDAYSTNQVKGRSGKWCERISRMVYRSASRVVCVSERVREQVATGSARSAKTTVIYNGVDPDLFSPPQSPPTSETILSVGSLIPIKGHALLIRAFAAIRDRFPLVRCDIIGEGSERDRLQSLTRELQLADRVRFLGRQSRSQVAKAMQNCAVFALPSRYEALGCVYLEAMSCAKPAIGCREQGIEEIIQHGRDGWLIEPDNLVQMTEALTTLLQDHALRQRMGAAAREKILHGFTLAHQSAQLVETLQECRE